MKRTMIFSIILLPLIVLAIMFLSSSIVIRSTYLYVERVEFVEENIVLNKETSSSVSQQLTVNIFPKLANNSDVEFWSEDEAVAVVDKNGVVTSKGFGSTYIYVRSKENITKQSYVKVTVTSEIVHSVTVDNAVSKMFVGENLNLNVSYSPTEAKNASFVFSSSNPDVLYVTKAGVLQALKPGDATITVSVKSDPDVKFSFDVQSKERIQDIWIDDVSDVVSGQKNFEFPEVKFSPNSVRQTVYYSSTDDQIATVNEKGEIEFLKAGTVTISASTDDFDGVITKKYSSTFGYFSSATILSSSVSEVKFEDYAENQEIDLSDIIKYNVFPTDANSSNLEFVSSNQNVAVITGGKLRIVGGGNTTITLIAKSSENDEIRSTFNLSVSRNVGTISFEKDYVRTGENQVEINVSSAPQDATEKLTLSVSDENVAKIENGVLHFTTATILNKFGKVTVTASVESGLTKTMTFVYLDESINTIDIDEEENLTFTLAKTGQRTLSFALICDRENLKDVSFVVKKGSTLLTQNGYIFTAIDKGEVQIEATIVDNQTQTKTLNFMFERKVEKIENLKVVAKAEGEQDKEYDSNKIYSSRSVFDFSYSLYPTNTTLETAQVSLVGDSATLSGNTVTFSKAGTVTIVISVDGVTEQIEITSTFMTLDGSVEFFNMKTVFDFEDRTYNLPVDFYKIKEGFEREIVEIESTDESLFTVSGGVLTFVGSGSASLTLTYKISDQETQTISKEIYVVKTADSLKFKTVQGGQVFETGIFVTNNNEVFLTPSSQNSVYFVIEGENLSDYTISFSGTNEIANVDSNTGKVTFKKFGTVNVQVLMTYKNSEKTTTKNIVITKTQNLIKTILPNQENGLETVLECGEKITLFPLSNNSSTTCQYSCSESDVLTIENGEIETLKGGLASITISSGDWNKTINIFVHKTATISGISTTKIETIKKTFDVGATIGTEDALLRKKIIYVSSNENIATVDKTGKISFISDGEVTISVIVYYDKDNDGEFENFEVETSNSDFTIKSTFGKIEITTDVEEINLQIQGANSGTSQIINITNVYPSDFFTIFEGAELEAVSTEYYKVEVLSQTQLKVTTLGRCDEGYVLVKYKDSESQIQIPIKIVQLATDVQFKNSSSNIITSDSTFNSSYVFSATVLPSNSNNKELEIEIISGSEIVDSWTTTNSNGEYVVTINFSGFGEVKIKATNANASKTISVTRNEDISNFDILFDLDKSGTSESVALTEAEKNANSQEVNEKTIFLGASQYELDLELSISLSGFDNFQGFTCSSLSGKGSISVSKDGQNGLISIVLPKPESDSTYSFEGFFSISYVNKNTGENILYFIKVVRDGIQSVTFGESYAELDNSLDKNYGLQQVRVFGNVSYYGGVVAYYRMPVNIAPSNSLLSNLEFSSSTGIRIDKGDGYVDIYFSTGGTVFDDMYVNNFSVQIEVSAKNKKGEVLRSYNFIVVNGVNIFDEEGYMKTQSVGYNNIVLQKNFGTKEDDTGKGDFVELTDYVNGYGCVYGNGYTLNLNALNTQYDEADEYQCKKVLGQISWEVIVATISNSMNLVVKGADNSVVNNSSSKWIVSFYTRHVAYCEISNVFRLQFPENNGYVKNSVIKKCNESAILLNSGGDVYLENVIMFNTGTRAIEIQKGSVYIKGIFDVYNFKDKNALKEFSSTIASQIINGAKDSGLTVTGKDGKTYANIVAISGKGKDFKIYYWVGISDDNTTGYEYIESGEHETANGMTKLSGSYFGTNYCAWSFNPDAKDVVTWDQQYAYENSTVSINDSYMISTMWKIARDPNLYKNTHSN